VRHWRGGDLALSAGMTRTLIAVSIVSAIVSGCAPPPPITLIGSRANIEVLTGEWSGTYESRETGREGSIWFSLSAGAEAHGDVLMTPRGRGQSYGRPPSEFEPRGSTMLTIRFVMVGDRVVEGTLDSYWDPDCGCKAWTSFTGKLTADAIAGEFVTHLASDRIAHGRWSVTRHRRRLR
jgi:hypothetical protein